MIESLDYSDIRLLALYVSFILLSLVRSKRMQNNPMATTTSYKFSTLCNILLCFNLRNCAKVRYKCNLRLLIVSFILLSLVRSKRMQNNPMATTTSYKFSTLCNILLCFNLRNCAKVRYKCNLRLLIVRSDKP